MTEADIIDMDIFENDLINEINKDSQVKKAEKNIPKKPIFPHKKFQIVLKTIILRI